MRGLEVANLTQNEEGMIMAIELMNRANSDRQLRELIFDREESKRYSRYIIDSEVRARKAAEAKLMLAEQKANQAVKEANQAVLEANKKLEQAKEQSIIILVNACKELGSSLKETVKLITNKYQLSEKHAIDIVEQNWK